MKWSTGIVPVCFALSICLPASSRAQDETTVIGSGVVCNTSAQVARFTDLMDKSNAQDALAVVNREAADPTACGAVIVAFEPGKKVAALRNSKGAYEIREIRVIAAATSNGWHVVTPQMQYTVLREPGIDI